MPLRRSGALRCSTTLNAMLIVRETVHTGLLRPLRCLIVSGRQTAAFYRCSRWKTAACLLLTFVAVLTPVARAQARTAARLNDRLEVFGMGTYYQPEYLSTSNRAGGITGGVSFDRKVFRFRPGVQIRGSYTNYDFMSQKLISVGPQLLFDWGRIHPYGDFLYGYGTASFNHPAPDYRGNNSTVWSYGGGIDFDLAKYWALRLDYQQQRWDFARQPFQPNAFNAGVRYVVHFRSRTGPQ
jgi:hypothetical protein